MICPQAHMINANSELCSKCVDKGLINCIENKCIKQSKIASILKSSALYFHKEILKIYDNVDLFICTNNFMKMQMINNGFEKKRISVIPTFKEKILISTTVYNGEKYILYVGRFSYEKAVDTLIYAYLNSNLYNNNIKLYLIGGNKNDLILNLDEKSKILYNQSCVFYGFLDKSKINTFINNSLYCVQPSRWYENMPNTILEAYSCNKSVITANIGSLKTLVIHNKTGLLYEYENIDDLKFKLEQLCNEILRTRISENIPSFFERFIPNYHYKKLIKIMEKLNEK
jgi:glycosyltransferase involved in cell wall biosynthesis